MISIFPFELKKLLQRKAALGAFIILLIAILGLFYQYFFVGQISGYSTNKVHGRDAVAINRRIAESHSGALTDNLANRIFNDYAKEQPTLKKKGVFNVGNYYVISQLIPNSTDKLIKGTIYLFTLTTKWSASENIQKGDFLSEIVFHYFNSSYSNNLLSSSFS